MHKRAAKSSRSINVSSKDLRKIYSSVFDKQLQKRKEKLLPEIIGMMRKEWKESAGDLEEIRFNCAIEILKREQFLPETFIRDVSKEAKEILEREIKKK